MKSAPDTTQATITEYVPYKPEIEAYVPVDGDADDLEPMV